MNNKISAVFLYLYEKMKNVLWVISMFCFLACQKPVKNEQLAFKAPSNFPTLIYNIEKNPPTKAGFKLGKKLFYDGRLAKDGQKSCASCHNQAFAFTDFGNAISVGVYGGKGFRNSLPIQNLAFQEEFMWDGAALHLDFQPLIPITSDVEMNESFPSIIEKLKQDQTYRTLFLEAFEHGEINTDNILKALAQFMVMMVSANSKYDQYIRNEGVVFTQQEKHGLLLFQEKCASCHATDLFTDQSYRNNGLPVNLQIEEEQGRGRVTGIEQDKHKFKVPSLRNVEKTFPYMHDGRFNTLPEVIDHYRFGVQDNPALDPILKQEKQIGIAISDAEKQALIAFLNTLTDYDFITNSMFQNEFN